MAYKPTLCLDFDGVVHSYTSGWQGARVISDPPVPGALGFMLGMLNSGWDVCIHSSRSGHLFARSAMRTWLRHHAGDSWYEFMGHYGLESVRFPLFKPAALITIDDRALTFRGDWPSDSELRRFKPWYKQPLHQVEGTGT